jgi:hypothetical protein
MHRYHQQLNRLGRLEKIIFCIDEVYALYGGSIDEPSSKRRDSVMNSIIQFVKDHTTIFPGCLKTVAIVGSKLWPIGNPGDVNDVLTQIYRILPALSPPRVINKENWTRLMAHPLTTDLNHVQDFTATKVQWREYSFDYPQILQRCRSLKKLRISALGKGSFEWAVQEKRMLGLDSSRGLAPLEYVLIESYTMSTNEIDDIAFAFSNTLQSIIVNEEIQPGPHPTIRIGKGWVDLPLLTNLRLNIYRNRLSVDEMILSHCPNLIHIELSDHPNEYSCQDIVPTLPADLRRLVELKLQG